MKYYVDKTYLKREDIELVTELLFVYPLLSQQAKDHIDNNRFWESGIFNNLSNIEYSNEKECDYFALPFKFKSSTEDRFLDILEKARYYNKKLICLNNDDFGGDYQIPDDIILFRTSFDASKRKRNEFAFPVFIPDINKHSSGYSENISVGFCGDSNRPIRKEALESLKSSDIKVDHVEVFSFFQNPIINKQQGRENFFRNLQENIFILTPRGCGNFSYRFYEALCFGRIPVFVNTDCVLPFENLIDYKKEIVFVEENDIASLPDKIKEYCNEYDLLERQKRCREIWENYLNPNGFLNNIKSCL
jgi:hypothetical protein